MFIKKIVFMTLFLSILFNIFPQGQNEIQTNQNIYLEKFLSEYYKSDLLIKDVLVKISIDTVVVSGTPDFKDKWDGIGQIVLAVSGAAVVVPDSKKIVFIIHFGGMPFGFVEVPTRKALLVSEGKISEKDFIASFISDKLPVPFDFPKDLLYPIIVSSEIWKGVRITECDASKIGEMSHVKMEGFLPEMLEAAYVRTDPADGSVQSIVAVVDFMNETDAKEFQELNDNSQMNSQIVRIGTVVYILTGTEDVIRRCLSALNPEPEKEIEKAIASPLNESDEIKKDGKRYYIIGGGFFFLFSILVFIFILSGKRKID